MIIDGEWEKDVESSLPQEEPDFDAIAEEEYWQHCDEAHDGKPCTCPKPAASAWDEWMRQHEAEAHGGKPCNCPEYTEPPF